MRKSAIPCDRSSLLHQCVCKLMIRFDIPSHDLDVDRGRKAKSDLADMSAAESKTERREFLRQPQRRS